MEFLLLLVNHLVGSCSLCAYNITYLPICYKDFFPIRNNDNYIASGKAIYANSITDNIDVYIVGRKMRQSGSLVDSLANEFVSRMHFDKCFITGSGLTAEFGLSNGTDETAAFQRTVIVKRIKSQCLKKKV